MEPPGQASATARPLDAPALKRWRQRLRLTLKEGAEALGIPTDLLEEYESGARLIPKTVLLAASAVAANLRPIKPWHGFPRADWVQLVEDMRSYEEGEPVVGRMIRAGEARRLHVFLTMVRQGPDLDLAMTDPALFRMLSCPWP
jgi:transcriptional regulator with XRE-family HTH domain